MSISSNQLDTAKLRQELNDAFSLSSKQLGGAKKKSNKKSSNKKSSNKKSSVKKKSANKSSSKKKSGSIKMSRSSGADHLKSFRNYLEYINKESGTVGPLGMRLAKHFRELAKNETDAKDQDELHKVARKLFDAEKKSGKLEKLISSLKSKLEKDMADKKAKKKEAKKLVSRLMKNSRNIDDEW